MRPLSSTTCSRPPVCTAAVATTLPCSTMPSLVVPPPISMLRIALVLVVRDLRRARAIGASIDSMLMPAVAVDEIAALLRHQAGNGLGILARSASR